MPTQQVLTQHKPFTVASTIGGSVFLSADKTCTLSPDNARHLAEQLHLAANNADSFITEGELMVPFSVKDIALLHHHKGLYEQQHQVKFADLGAFVSYIVSQQLRMKSEQEVIHV